MQNYSKIGFAFLGAFIVGHSFVMSKFGDRN